MNRHWRRVWLIGLLIALLPLRSWAWAAMPLSAPVVGLEVRSAASPACHAAPSVDEVAQDEEAPGHADCKLCDLCHAGVITPPDARWQHARAPACAPAWPSGLAIGREGGDDLFRPPRG
jgi:hypothetical protein